MCLLSEMFLLSSLVVILAKTQKEDVCCVRKGKDIQVYILPLVAVVTESEKKDRSLK